jgi:phytoene dehydrogenase-like protein
VSYDAIVIGAGLNGLVTAGYLARAGLKVLVLERRAIVGGSAVTQEFAPGFRCDTARHDVGWLSPKIISDLGLVSEHGLKLVSSSGEVLAPTRDGDFLLLHTRTDTTAAALRRFSPADADRWPAFTARIAKLAGFLEHLYTGPAPRVDASSLSDLRRLLGLGLRLRGLGKTDMVELLRTVPMSVAELLDDAFECDALKGVLGAQGITHTCLGPRAGGTGFVYLHHQVGRSPGAFRTTLFPQGAIGELSRALADSARAAGAEIRTGARVAGIAIHDARVTGVVLASGEEIAAKRVVSSADPRQTFLDLCDPGLFEPELVRAVRHIKYRGVWAKVNLALAELPNFPGLPVDGKSTCPVVISPSLDYLEHAYDDAKYGRVSEHPFLEARILTMADPSLAPAGKHVMSVHVQYAPYHLRGGSWDVAARSALGDRVVATLGRYAPNLPGAVLHRQVLTPLDLETEFALPEGSAYHGELTLDQILFMRPVPECSRHRTPVPGLYLCGSGTHPGGGIAGGAGANAAAAILRSRPSS